MDQKSVILSFLLTYVNTIVNNSSITEAKLNHSSRIPLAELMLFFV